MVSGRSRFSPCRGRGCIGTWPGIVDSARFDVVVVDSPPLGQERGIVHSAMRAATDVVVTLAPTSPEWSALPRVWAAARDVDCLRTRTAPTSVLWNRVRVGTTAAQVYRELLADAGHYCLRAAIPTRERSAQLVGARGVRTGGHGGVGRGR